MGALPTYNLRTNVRILSDPTRASRLAGPDSARREAREAALGGGEVALGGQPGLPGRTGVPVHPVELFGELADPAAEVLAAPAQILLRLDRGGQGGCRGVHLFP